MKQAIQTAIDTANAQIKYNKGFNMTNYFIRLNIEMVESNPDKHGKQFCAMYNSIKY